MATLVGMPETVNVKIVFFRPDVVVLDAENVIGATATLPVATAVPPSTSVARTSA